MRLIRDIFSALFQLIAAFAFLGGTFYLWSAVAAREYLAGVYYALLAIALFVFATLIQIALSSTTHRLEVLLKNIETNTLESNKNLLRIGRLLARQQGEATNNSDIPR